VCCERSGDEFCMGALMLHWKLCTKALQKKITSEGSLEGLISLQICSADIFHLKHLIFKSMQFGENMVAMNIF